MQEQTIFVDKRKIILIGVPPQASMVTGRTYTISVDSDFYYDGTITPQQDDTYELVYNTESEKKKIVLKFNKEGKLYPVNGSAVSPSSVALSKNTQLSGRANAAIRDFVMSRIYERFTNLLDPVNSRYTFFGHLMVTLNDFLKENGMEKERACLLSFCTHNPIYGALLYLQATLPFRTPAVDNQSLYLNTTTLYKWLTSPHGDRALGYSVSELDYDSEYTKLFKEASSMLERAKAKEAIQQVHSRVSSVSSAGIHPFNHVITHHLKNVTGNRFEIHARTPTLFFHEALFTYNLLMFVNNNRNFQPRDLLSMLGQFGATDDHALKVAENKIQVSTSTLSNDHDPNMVVFSDAVAAMRKVNLIHLMHPATYNTAVDFEKL